MGYPARKPKTKVKTNAGPETIRGAIQRSRFHNPVNGYCVISIDTGNESTGLITAVGYMPSIREGDEFKFKGYWTNNPKYGKQFAFEEYELLMPQSRQGIIRYLATLAYGVGKVKAAKIVDALGEDCIVKLKENPDALKEVPDITMEQAEEIITKLNENTVLAELSSMICRQGVSPGLAARIYQQYGPESIQVVKNNPYILSEDMYRVGFITADRIAQAMGIDPDSPYRVEAAMEFVLKNATEDGHCYLPPQGLIIAMKKVLGKGCAVGVDEIKAASRELVRKGKTVYEEDETGKGCIYLKGMQHTEIQLANRIRELLGQKVEVKGGAEQVDKMVELAQRVIGMEYAPEQREAIKTVLENPLTVVTGGPGVGKSFTTNGFLIAYHELYPDNYIYLASPTGRAAKRLTEVTGREAKTIHRLLEYHPEIGFRVDKMNPLQGPGLLIVDEFSMTDIELSMHLFNGIPDNIQVVLVGDVGQLPSVGPGNVLRDLIESGVVPSVRLKYNYRQANGSKIAEYADMIRRGIVPPLKNQDGDVESIFIEDVSQTALKVLNEIRKAIDDGYGLMDFQVLTPIHRGPAGVSALNEAIQELVNPAAPGKKEYKQYKEVFRIGDKVMVVKNDYSKGVFNGDIGIVSDINDNKDNKGDKDGEEGPGIWVKFESSQPVFFPADDTGELMLAYVNTVHRAQGSEFPLVIVVCVRSHYIMLQRNLLYTAITRAKEKLVLVCQDSAVEVAVKNDKIKERYSRLREKLISGVSQNVKNAQ